MRQDDIVYCEMCGRPIRRKDARIVYVEGAKLLLCPDCYKKVVKKNIGKEIREVRRVASKPVARRARPYKRQRNLESLEVVEDYADRVRSAREKLGWSQRVLANAIGEGENVIKRIESGRLTPSIDQAKRLERVLNVKLLEPIVDEDIPSMFSNSGSLNGLTLGDIASIKRKKK